MSSGTYAKASLTANAGAARLASGRATGAWYLATATFGCAMDPNPVTTRVSIHRNKQRHRRIQGSWP